MRSLPTGAKSGSESDAGAGVAGASRRIGVLTIALAISLGMSGTSRGSASELSDAESRELLAALAGENGDDARAALARIEAARDRRFVAPLIELLRAAEVGIASPAAGDASARALETLSGERFGADWAAWVRWYAASDAVPPAGFVGWKGALLGRKDARFEAVLRDGLPSRIRVEEIVWGGVAYEGIPALDSPSVEAARAATWLGDSEPVFGVALGGEARAYPLRILDWHELANDTVGGEPIALAYCTLCGTGIAYRRTLADGRVLDFGSSGLLLRSNKLMVDRQTRTLWNQFTGQAALGPLAASEVELVHIPSVVARWRDWRAEHPSTTVVSMRTGHRRPYRSGAAYGGYFASPDTMFPAPRERRELAAKERVFGIRLEAAAKAWPLSALAERRVLNDDVGDTPVVLVAQRGTIDVAGDSIRDGPARWNAGGEVRAYRRGTRRFSPDAREDHVRDATGGAWRVTEEALIASDGTRAERVAGVLSYWFGWTAFVPHTEIWKTP